LVERIVINIFSLAGALPFLGGRRSFRSLLWNIHEGATELSALVSELQPDCVVSFLPYSNLVSCYSKLRYRWQCPLLCSDRNFLSHELKRLPCTILHRMLARILYKQATLHVAVSTRAAVDLHAILGVPLHRILSIPNGVDIPHVSLLAAQDQAEARSPAFTMVAAGRLNWQKGFDVLLSAVSMLPDRDWRLLILGEGEERSNLISLCEKLGILDRVAFLGWQANPYPVVASADAFVLSSRWEGWPNALLEAIALGKAVVSTDCESGPAEILANGKAGILVRVDDPVALMEGIAKLMADPCARREASCAARARAEQFGIPEMIGRYDNAIRQSMALVASA
jgi:N-acetylgalactosamine-N,N'-diacetylbacillosaminyl-diphospho-undecaprenol 4-alpha-N-acetylgalactosaminyltransferase